MIVVNKCVKSHNSLGMISKVTEIYNKPAPSCPELTKLPNTTNKPVYRKAYEGLFRKNRKHGLSLKSFKTNADYARALVESQKYVDKQELNEFIKESVNGGMSFDQECVFI